MSIHLAHNLGSLLINVQPVAYNLGVLFDSDLSVGVLGEKNVSLLKKTLSFNCKL